jgi:hypothetical protein
MSRVSRYWNLVRLDPTGHRRIQEQPDAKRFFQQQFGGIDEPVQAELQAQLLTQMRQGEDLAQQYAQLCLRCFISSQIEQVCINLEQQFGLTHGFSREELFPLVLNDDGRFAGRGGTDRTYISVAENILNGFESDKGSLTTWTIRLVKHNRDLNQFLLESGVCLLSDWAILNDTTPSKLRRVLTDFQPMSAPEVDAAVLLLDSYHNIYRADRLIARQAGAKGACPAPTPGQLERMQTTLSKLQRLADRLRQYRIASRTGRMPTVSIDAVGNHGEGLSLGDRLAAPSQETPEPSAPESFLTAYRQQFGPILDAALESVVQTRLKTQKGDKAQHFLTALQLFHCQGQSMGAIAKAVGLQAQFQVSRLMNLKAFREDVRHQMFDRLRQFVKQAVGDTLGDVVSPDRLAQVDAQIEIALNEQITDLLQAAAAQAQSPKDYVTGTVFSRTLCQLIDRLHKSDQPLR